MKISKTFYQNYPRASHPMGILSSMVNALRSFYPQLGTLEEEITITMTRLLAKVRTMAAMSYKISRGHRVVYPRPDLTYCENFLNMMFDTPVRPYEINRAAVNALRVFWILHADHEQNCSTSAVRVVGSARVNLYAAISSGIAALWGPLHGGANQAVIEMLTAIQADGGNYQKAIERARDRNDPFRLMGFGHRVYKTYDPRAKIMKKVCDELLESLQISPIRCWILPRNSRRSATKRSLLYRPQPVPQYRLLQRDRPAGHRHPHQHVHGDVRHRPASRVDRPVEGKRGRSQMENLPAPPDLHGCAEEYDFVPIHARG
jgi:hypothetical protein